MSRDKYFKGYNPDFVSAYGKRDWQKDMRLMTESREALYYWLGQYAEASNEVSFWKGEATAEKERADKAKEDYAKLRSEHIRLMGDAGEYLEREQKLREALEDITTYPPFEETNNGDRFYEQIREMAKELLSSLYPKEETKP